MRFFDGPIKDNHQWIFYQFLRMASDIKNRKEMKGKKGVKKEKKERKKNNSCECRLKPHMPVLKLLLSPETTPVLKNQVLKHCSNNCIHTICEIVYNLLKGNIPLSPSQKQQLAPKKHILRKLVKPQSTKKRRAALVKQKGGSLLKIVLNQLLGK